MSAGCQQGKGADREGRWRPGIMGGVILGLCALAISSTPTGTEQLTPSLHDRFWIAIDRTVALTHPHSRLRGIRMAWGASGVRRVRACERVRACATPPLAHMG